MDMGSSLSSCHQTIFFYSSAHCFHTSLKILMSSNEQECASWEHCNMCAVVSSAFPQVHVVSPVYNVHLFMLWSMGCHNILPTLREC